MIPGKKFRRCLKTIMLKEPIALKVPITIATTWKWSRLIMFIIYTNMSQVVTMATNDCLVFE